MGMQNPADWTDAGSKDVAVAERLQARQVVKIVLRTYPEACTYCGNRSPRTPIQAQFSLSFGLAAALHTGDLCPQDYRDPFFDDPEVRSLETRVELRPEPELGQDGRRSVILEIDDDDGRHWTARVDEVEGDPSKPLGLDAVVAKFVRQAGGALGTTEAALLARHADGPCGGPDGKPGAHVASWWRRLLNDRDSGSNVVGSSPP
jgi:2-methylcitrate dehydratase PrpD